MRIEGQDAVNTISKQQTESVFGLSGAPAGSGRVAPNSSPSLDGVDLGNHSHLVALALASGAEQGTGSVQQLRALVQSGQYDVDSGALSQSILSAALGGY